MSNHDQVLQDLAREVRDELLTQKKRLVLAESCTGGAIASLFTEIAGTSEFFCGSAVTYRNRTKSGWLNVSQEDLDAPDIGPVSEQVARQMCQGVLYQSPEADVAASVTGHLGPDVENGLDGVVFVGVIQRDTNDATVEKFQLPPVSIDNTTLRLTRRTAAIIFVLQCLLKELRK